MQAARETTAAANQEQSLEGLITKSKPTVNCTRLYVQSRPCL